MCFTLNSKWIRELKTKRVCPEKIYVKYCVTRAVHISRPSLLHSSLLVQTWNTIHFFFFNTSRKTGQNTYPYQNQLRAGSSKMLVFSPLGPQTLKTLDYSTIRSLHIHMTASREMHRWRAFVNRSCTSRDTDVCLKCRLLGTEGNKKMKIPNFRRKSGFFHLFGDHTTFNAWLVILRRQHT